ncbi:MAG TPA: PEGA domain-containing protein [Candidatus Angelobacter sp.]|jgi:hypothetical protein
MKSRSIVLILAIVTMAGSSLCHAQTCKVTFEVAYLDRLHNMNNGIPAKSLKDIEKRLSKYGDVCYAGDKKADLVFFFHTTPATYHGTRVYTDNSTAAAAAANGSGSAAAAASSSSTTAVPYAVDYSVFILDIEAQQPDGSYKVLRTLDQKGLYKTMYGIGYGKGKHPIPNLIEAGAKWLHENPDALASQSSAHVIAVSNTDSAELPQGKTSLDIISDPDGAEIILDGSFVGDTPSMIEVKAGDHTISIKKSGYKAWERKLRTSSGTVKVAASLDVEQKN